jgi:hypothetical protein
MTRSSVLIEQLRHACSVALGDLLAFGMPARTSTAKLLLAAIGAAEATIKAAASGDLIRASAPTKIGLDGDGFASVSVDVKDDGCTKDPTAVFSLHDEVVVVDAAQFNALVEKGDQS